MTTNDGYDVFVRRAMKVEMLDAETERTLSQAWREHGDERALHRLVNAYLRLAISESKRYRGYGMSMPDLIQEAGLGLMKAAKKFDPERGVRFSTYALWWINASLKEYILRNWSLVRTVSTARQKTLFFNLRRVRARLEHEAAEQGYELNSQRLRELIAVEMGVPLRDVEQMESRLAGPDFSLNSQRSSEDSDEWIEVLEDESPQAAETVVRNADLRLMRDSLQKAMGKLSERERFIIIERWVRDEPRTLKSLGKELSLSNERVRQIEARAFEKMQAYLERNRKEVKELCSA
jgi:RNA polymerase sigma-32 factor